MANNFICFCFLFLVLSGIAQDILAQPFLPDAQYEICFTPGGNCTDLLTRAIQQAKKCVYVQAFSFTSRPIARALAKARKNGVAVKVILDKSQVETEKYSEANYLNRQNIPIWIDFNVAVAHNKVVIIDDDTVFTGSFNFTKAAQEKNAENLLMIQDKNVVRRYKENWLKRQSVSMPFVN